MTPHAASSGETKHTSPTAYALLGLLSLKSWSTYELAKQVRRSLNWMWPRAERRLYDEPKRLVAGGLATAISEQTGARPRTVYKITPAGRAALREWLDSPSVPRSSEFEAMLKVFFADAGSLAQLESTLGGIKTEAAERLNTLLGMAEQGLADGSPFPKRHHLSAIGLAMQFEQEKAMLHWAGWAQQQLTAWTASDDPGNWDHRTVMSELVEDARAALAGTSASVPDQ